MAETSASVPNNTKATPNYPALALGVLIVLVAAKFLIHALLSGRYGYFRDELYYLDMGRHLATGYVDAAPLVGVYAKIALLLGGGLHVLRIMSALAGAGVVALTILLTRWMDGNRYAQLLAGLCALFSPAVLAVDNFMSMNAFEPLFWMACVAVLIRIVQTGNSRLWIWFGVLAGLGLENKHSMAFFGIAVVVALLLTPLRRELGKKWIWLCGVVAFALAIPNLIWQVQHHFATLEDLENVRRMGKNIVLGPAAFVWQQVFTVHPVIFALAIAGLVWLFRRKDLRALAWTFVVFFVVMFLMHAKNYYLFPIYPMLFAAGAVQVEEGFARWKATVGRVWPKAAFATIVVISTIPVDLFLLPIFSPEKYVRYSGFLHLGQIKTERHHESVWPQLFADQFGWEELVGEVAKIYNSLPAEERAHTGIFANNYGEAGAIDLWGPQYGLPPAISAHQNHYFWGPPQSEPETYIITQSNREDLERYFTLVQEVGRHYHPYGMEEENTAIWLCRGPKFKLAEVWPQLKHWN